MENIKTTKDYIEKTNILQALEKFHKQILLENLDKNEQEKILANNTVIADLDVEYSNTSNKEILDISLNCLKGFPKLKIKNFEIFIYFCLLHGLIPILNRIIINGIDVVAYSKELEQFLIFVIEQGSFNFGIYSELKKIFKILENTFACIKGNILNWRLLKDILNDFERIFLKTSDDLRKIYDHGLVKRKNIGTLPENICSEIVLRIENRLRKLLNIFSTYMISSSYQEDNHQKTDLIWGVKFNQNEPYKRIPIQITKSYLQQNKAKDNSKQKIADIEKYLFKILINKGALEQPFVLMSINGEFKKYTESKKFENDYINRYDNLDNIRENHQFDKKQNSENFPFFIDNISPHNITSPEIMIFFLHLIFQAFTKIRNNIKLDENDLFSYINRFIKKHMNQILKSNFDLIHKNRTNTPILRINRTNFHIDKIQVKIDGKNVHPAIINENFPKSNLLVLNKYIFNIFYKKEEMGTIFIYI